LRRMRPCFGCVYRTMEPSPSVCEVLKLKTPHQGGRHSARKERLHSPTRRKFLRALLSHPNH
jgi:hypothetical protein